MRFDSIALRGLGSFTQDVELDLANLPGQLVAVVGENGAGKSTLLELFASALYRETPTRGTLAVLANARDAFVEARVVNGHAYTIRHSVDGVSGKGESLVLDEHGAPVLADGKVRSFDAWAKTHLPSREVLYASTFAPQGSGGFLALSAGARKAVLLRVLGIERLEQLAERARERVRSAREAAVVLLARLNDERERGGDVDEARRALEEQRTHSRNTCVVLELTRGCLADVQAKLVEAREIERVRVQTRGRRIELDGELSSAHKRLDEIDGRIGNNARLIHDRDAIRAAVAKASAIEDSLRKCELTKAAAVQQRDAAWAREEAQALTAVKATQRAGEAFRRVDRAEEQLRASASIDEAAAALADKRAARASLEADERVAEHELNALRQWLESAHAVRSAALRAALELVVDADDPVCTANAAIAEDDGTLAAMDFAPGQVRSLHESHSDLKRAVVQHRDELLTMERIAARAGEMRAAREELHAARNAMEAAKQEHHAAEKERIEAMKRWDAHHDEVARIVANEDLLQGALAALEPQRKLGDRLTQAEARIAELEPQRDALLAQIEQLEGQLSGLTEPPPQPPMPDPGPAERRAHQAEVEARSAAAAVAVCEARLATARAAAKRFADLEIKGHAAADELADWTRLAEDLGRDGLQALEIDAAGPELTELVNDLLRSCVGSRWTVSIEATRTSADGKRQLEGCEVRILDSESGREGTAESLSGGESVIVGEAISLALSMLACRRAGIEGPTLVRDESGAALDPKNARAYVAMLRRACELVGASKCLFVSHSQEVQELADARIVIADGRVEVAA